MIITPEADATGLSKSLVIFLSVVAVTLITGVVLLTVLMPSYSHFVYDTDFSNYWTSSKLTLDGKVLDLFRGQETYFGHMQQFFGPDFQWHAWSYPPHYLFFTLPLALLPLPASLIVFQLATLALYLHATSLLVRRSDLLTIAFILPFVMCNILAGQNGFLTAALMLYGLGLRGRSPVLAGIAFGLLTVKPQLGLLLPFLLLYERRWTVIVSASITAALSIVVSAWMFGIEAWTGYVGLNLPYQTLVMRELEGPFLSMMLSLYGALRNHGITADPALAIHLPLAVVGFCLFVWTLFRMRTPEARAFSMVLATFMVTPYSLTYDLGALTALSLLFLQPRSNAGAPGDGASGVRLAHMAVAMLPIIAVPLAHNGLTLAPLIIAGSWAALLYAEARTTGTVTN